jgi:hypothetical protein
MGIGAAGAEDDAALSDSCIGIAGSSTTFGQSGNPEGRIALMKLAQQCLVVAAVGVLLAGLAACSKGEPTAPATTDTAAPASAADIKVGREPNAEFQVTGNDLGIHSFTTQPTVPTKAIRLNCSPTWGAANPAKGQYDWTQFDASVAQAESWGYTDIMYVFCGTPEWAGVPVQGEDFAAFGPKTAQAPKDLADWDAFVTAVAQRYKGRITGYEVWNEPSSPQFFTGSPEIMGRMTERAYTIIKQADPGAYVVSASTQTHRAEYYDGFFPDYLVALKKANWPIDGFSAHFYPEGAKGGPTDRVNQIHMLQHDVTAAGAPADLPVWDTEVNYSVGVPGGEPKGRIVGNKAAAWTAQTYLDGWRTGVRRTYWYLWTAEYYGFPGIQMRADDPATQALTTLSDWVLGADFTGCDENLQEVGLITCHFQKDGKPFDISWSEDKPVKLELSGTKSVCPVFGGKCTDESGAVKVDMMPVRIS